MKKSLILTLAFLLLILNSYAQDKDFILNGKIDNIQNETLYLFKDTGESREFINSIICHNDAFQFSGKISQSIAAELRLSDLREIRFFISPGQMHLAIPVTKFKYGFITDKLKGSEAQDRYDDFQSKLHQNKVRKQKITDALRLPEVKNDSIQTANFLSQYRKLNRFKQAYFYKYASSPVIPYLIYQDFFQSKCNIADIKEYLTILNLANPKGLYVQNLNKRVHITEQFLSNGKFPKFKATTLEGDVFSLENTTGKNVLLYFWRAWTPENNQKYYKELEKLSLTNPNLKIISIIRNSSFNKTHITGTNNIDRWKPTPLNSQNIVEIESLDNSVEIVRYLDRHFHAFLIQPNGNISYHQDHFDPELLKFELSKHLSNRK